MVAATANVRAVVADHEAIYWLEGFESPPGSFYARLARYMLADGQLITNDSLAFSADRMTQDPSYVYVVYFQSGGYLLKCRKSDLGCEGALLAGVDNITTPLDGVSHIIYGWQYGISRISKTLGSTAQALLDDMTGTYAYRLHQTETSLMYFDFGGVFYRMASDGSQTLAEATPLLATAPDTQSCLIRGDTMVCTVPTEGRIISFSKAAPGSSTDVITGEAFPDPLQQDAIGLFWINQGTYELRRLPDGGVVETIAGPADPGPVRPGILAVSENVIAWVDHATDDVIAVARPPTQ